MADLRGTIEAAVAEAAEDAGEHTGLVVTEFIVIAQASGFDSDGEHIDQVVIIPEGGSESRILGLLEHARIRMHADVLHGYDG